MNFSSPLSSRLDNDKLMMMSRDRAAELGHLVLEPTKNLPGAENLAGIAVAFAAMAHRFGRSPQELYEYGLKILTEPHPHHGHGNALVDSLRDFADLRVRNNPII